MAGSVYCTDTTVVFKFPYSAPLNAELKTVTRYRVTWDDTVHGWVLALAELESDAGLRATVGTFVTENGFSTDAALKALLWPGTLAGTAAGSHLIGPGRLTAELLPETLRGSDQRRLISDADWERLYGIVFARACGRCQVCGARCRTPDGRPQPLHCHELWTFTHCRGRPVQRLDGLIPLCSACNRVRHCGLATLSGEYDSLVQHLRQVNGWTTDQAVEDLKRAERVYVNWHLIEWDLDLSLLAGTITIDGAPDLYVPASDR